MANRNVFETMLAELCPLRDSHDVEESSDDGSYDYLLELSYIIFMKEHQCLRNQKKKYLN